MIFVLKTSRNTLLTLISSVHIEIDKRSITAGHLRLTWTYPTIIDLQHPGIRVVIPQTPKMQQFRNVTVFQTTKYECLPFTTPLLATIQRTEADPQIND